MNMVLHPLTRQALDNFSSHPSHALVILGPKGIGKEYVAYNLALQLVGERNKHHIKLITPNDRNTTTIEMVRAVRADVQKAATGNNAINRVVIFAKAESIPPAAANALLKVLEEPASNTLFILLASHSEVIPATLVSRSQVIRIVKPDKADVIQYFSEHRADKQDIEQLYLLADGLPGAIQTFVEQTETDPAVIIGKIKKTLSKSPYERLATINDLIKEHTTEDLLAGLEKLAHAGMKAAAKQRKNALVARWVKFLDKIEYLQNQPTAIVPAKLALTDLFLSL